MFSKNTCERISAQTKTGTFQYIIGNMLVPLGGTLAV